MSDTNTITLSKPITHDDKTFAEVTIREATVGDMVAGDLVEGATLKAAAIYASVIGVPLPAVRQMTFGDYQRVMAAVDALGGNG